MSKRCKSLTQKGYFQRILALLDTSKRENSPCNIASLHQFFFKSPKSRYLKN